MKINSLESFQINFLLRALADEKQSISLSVFINCADLASMLSSANAQSRSCPTVFGVRMLLLMRRIFETDLLAVATVTGSGKVKQ